MAAENFTNLSDEILLTRIHNGDDNALETLIKRYERLLKTIIYYEIQNAEEEADIYSETRLAIMRRLRRRADDIASAEQLIDSEGMEGHRPLLCGANHTYYECNSSDVYTHTTTTSCPPTGAHQMLLCQTSGHDHRCSGCKNLYSPWDSTLVDAHRVRTCYYCNQSFRQCDSNLYCSSSPLLSHDGY
ncbi:hypothetical protein F4054_12435 [Candidatus Poribacteria bacterium]|nr:hypothetical protein [Candidatus Poribacteria bacterium]MYG08500.1 hypothetical protein [Candidatus Poribacteria bacterium]MYK23051.1 hypothetical protein [Candidatus Poribacteria bacterium]